LDRLDFVRSLPTNRASSLTKRRTMTAVVMVWTLRTMTALFLNYERGGRQANDLRRRMLPTTMHHGTIPYWHPDIEPS
jgi:hypothetical protein